MEKLIDANALKKAIKNTTVEIATETWSGLYERVIAEIDNAPEQFDSKAYDQGYKQAICDARNAQAVVIDNQAGEALIEYIEKSIAGKAEADDAAKYMEKITAEIVGIIREVMPQIIEIAKEYSQPTPEGEWEPIKKGSCITWYDCSVCRKCAIDRYDFCPNCGARMKKEDGQAGELISSEALIENMRLFETKKRVIVE